VRRHAQSRVGYAVGFTAAILFGASSPLAKRLVDDTDPQMLAGLLYLGAFLAVAIGARRPGRVTEARIVRSDLGALSGLVATGGVAAPILLMFGLRRLDAVPTSLLLNLEGPFTVLIGLLLFREHLGRRAFAAVVLVFGGATVLTVTPGSIDRVDLLGVVLIVAACACWGIDNNLTQRLTVRDPFAIVVVKTSTAATINVVVAFARGTDMPGGRLAAAALMIGAVSYGISILLDAYALRLLGAAREAVIFATAPIGGVAIAIVVLGETLRAQDAIGATIMAVGTVALLRVRHDHRHTHEPISHEHRHLHDEHHEHTHPPGADSMEPHSHPHVHEQLVHQHAHVSDLHHRHDHSEEQ